MPVQPSSNQIRCLSFNVAKNYSHVDVLLAELQFQYDIIFVQEPPWQTIRHAPSAFDKEGTAITGAPRSPGWTTMVRTPEKGSRPRVMAYVSTRLAHFRPSYRRDLIDDRDVMIVTLFGSDGPIHLMNVYSDDEHRAVKVCLCDFPPQLLSSFISLSLFWIFHFISIFLHFFVQSHDSSTCSRTFQNILECSIMFCLRFHLC